MSKLWWDGEKNLAEMCKHDTEYFDRLVNSLDKALKDGHLSGRLVGTRIDKDVRVIIFYLDLWHGKHFPFESLDLINEY